MSQCEVGGKAFQALLCRNLRGMQGTRTLGVLHQITTKRKLRVGAERKVICSAK